MRVALFTREFPPQIYGGAGVHVDYLSRELAKEIIVEVHCWGPQKSDNGNLHVRGAVPWEEITNGTEGKFKNALEALSLNLKKAKPVFDEFFGRVKVTPTKTPERRTPTPRVPKATRTPTPRVSQVRTTPLPRQTVTPRIR